MSAYKIRAVSMAVVKETEDGVFRPAVAMLHSPGLYSVEAFIMLDTGKAPENVWNYELTPHIGAFVTV